MKNKCLAAVLLLVMLMQTMTAFASETKEVLSINRAMEFAVSGSKTLRDLSTSNTKLNRQLIDAQDSIIGVYVYNTIIRIETQIKQIQAQITQNDRTVQSVRDNLRYSVTEAFAAIVSAENALDLFDQSMALQKKQLDISKVKVGLGLMSQADYDSQNNAYKQSLQDRNAKLLAIDNAYHALNQIIGRSAANRYTLEIDLPYEPLKTSLSGHIDYIQLTSNAVKKAQDEVEIAEFQQKNYMQGEGSPSEEDLRDGVEQAQSDLGEIKEQLADKVRSLHNSILNQENQYETARMKLAGAKQQIPVMEAKLALGRITQLELDKALFEIKQQEESLRGLAWSHALQVMRFQNANLYQ